MAATPKSVYDILLPDHNVLAITDRRELIPVHKHIMKNLEPLMNPQKQLRAKSSKRPRKTNRHYVSLALLGLMEANLNDPTLNLDSMALRPFLLDTNTRLRWLRGCTNEQVLAEYGPDGHWTKLRPTTQSQRASHILNKFGISRIESSIPTCCLLHYNHPLWRDYKRALRISNKRNRLEALKKAVSKYPQTHLTLPEVEDHIRYHNPEQPKPAAAQTKKVEAALAELTTMQADILKLAAATLVIDVQQLQDIFDCNIITVYNNLKKLKLNDLLYLLPRSKKSDGRSAYFLTSLGKRCAEELLAGEDADEPNDPRSLRALVKTGKIAAKVSGSRDRHLLIGEANCTADVNQRTLSHDLTAAEITAFLYHDANRERSDSEQLTIEVEGQAPIPVTLSMRKENILGPSQLYMGHVIEGHKNVEREWVGKRKATTASDVWCALGAKTADGEDLAHPCLIEYDSGSITSTRTVGEGQIWEYVALARERAANRRFPDYKAIDDYEMPLLVITQSNDAYLLSKDKRTHAAPPDENLREKDINRVNSLVKYFQGAQKAAGWKEFCPPIFIAIYSDLKEMGWETPVWCLHRENDDGNVARMTLWKALRAADRPLRRAGVGAPDSRAVLRVDQGGARSYRDQAEKLEKGHAKLHGKPQAKSANAAATNAEDIELAEMRATFEQRESERRQDNEEYDPFQ